MNARRFSLQEPWSASCSPWPRRSRRTRHRTIDTRSRPSRPARRRTPTSSTPGGWPARRRPRGGSSTTAPTPRRCSASDVKQGLRVSIPDGAPTGIVFNGGAGAGDFAATSSCSTGNPEDLRLARRARHDGRGPQRRLRRAAPSTRVWPSARPTSRTRSSTSTRPTSHNGRIDVFDRNVDRPDVGRCLPRPEAAEGLRPVRDPEPQRHAVRDLRADPEGQRRRAGRPRSRLRRCLRHGWHVPGSGRESRSAQRAVGPRLGSRRLRPVQQRSPRRQFRRRRGSTPTDGTASTGTPTGRSRRRTAARSRSTACGPSASAAGPTSPTTARERAVLHGRP